jgi:hypothetical protein
MTLVKRETQGDDRDIENPFITAVPGQVLVFARARRVLEELPRLMRAGLGLAALGAVIDIGYHVGTQAPGMGHGSIAFIGHTVTLFGMVVTMLGLVGAALKRRPVEARPTQKGESR